VLGDAAQLAVRSPIETPEGPIDRRGLAKRASTCVAATWPTERAQFTRYPRRNEMSGVDSTGRKVRKGKEPAIRSQIRARRNEKWGKGAADLAAIVERIASAEALAGGGGRKPKRWESSISRTIIKQGIRERFARLMVMGMRTLMITGGPIR